MRLQNSGKNTTLLFIRHQLLMLLKKLSSTLGISMIRTSKISTRIYWGSMRNSRQPYNHKSDWKPKQGLRVKTRTLKQKRRSSMIELPEPTRELPIWKIELRGRSVVSQHQVLPPQAPHRHRIPPIAKKLHMHRKRINHILQVVLLLPRPRSPVEMRMLQSKLLKRMLILRAMSAQDHLLRPWPNLLLLHSLNRKLLRLQPKLQHLLTLWPTKIQKQLRKRNQQLQSQLSRRKLRQQSKSLRRRQLIKLPQPNQLNWKKKQKRHQNKKKKRRKLKRLNKRKKIKYLLSLRKRRKKFQLQRKKLQNKSWKRKINHQLR